MPNNSEEQAMKVKMKILTLDSLIEAATEAKANSPLGGETVVHLCEQDREYIAIGGTLLDVDEDGAVFLVCI
jgi:hypothetical protein